MLRTVSFLLALIFICIPLEKGWGDETPTPIIGPIETITYGEDTTIYDMNFWLYFTVADGGVAWAEENSAYTSVTAPYGFNGGASSLAGLDVLVDPGGYTMEEIQDYPVNITIEFSYNYIGNFGVGWVGTAGVIVATSTEEEAWLDWTGPYGGSNSALVTQTYECTVGDLIVAGEAGGYAIAVEAFSTATSVVPEGTGIAQSQMTINWVKFEFPGPGPIPGDNSYNILHRDGAIWNSDTGWDMGTPPYYPGSAYARDLEFSGSSYQVLHKDGAIYDSIAGWNMATPPYYAGSDYAKDIEVTATDEDCILHKDGALWYSDTGWTMTTPPYYAGSNYARALELRADDSYVILHKEGALYDSTSGWVMTTPPYYAGTEWVVDMKLEAGGYVLLHRDGALWSTAGGWVLDTPPYYAGSDYARDLELLDGGDYVILHKDGALYDSVEGWNMDTPPYYPGSEYVRDLEVQ